MPVDIQMGANQGNEARHCLLANCCDGWCGRTTCCELLHDTVHVLSLQSFYWLCAEMHGISDVRAVLSASCNSASYQIDLQTWHVWKCDQVCPTCLTSDRSPGTFFQWPNNLTTVQIPKQLAITLTNVSAPWFSKATQLLPGRCEHGDEM